MRTIWKKFREMPEEQRQTYCKNPQRLGIFIYAGRNGNGDEASATAGRTAAVV